MSVLGQQLVVVLEEAPPRSALEFSGQAAFAMKALERGLLNYRTAALAIQSIVVVAAQLYFYQQNCAWVTLRAGMVNKVFSIGALPALAYYQKC